MTSHKLVVAEKPSVAMSIAKVLGARGRKDGYLEGNGWLVSWCVGHLVALAPADAYDARYSRWSLNDLPILPAPWQFQTLPDTRKQMEILRELMRRDDVSSLVCATDAGREGELIFRLVYRECGCGKPFQRLWISSMEEGAIREGFENLRDSAQYDRLYDAALCRAKADWLVGINATRLFTALHQGGVLNVGRVLTPTLALLTEREAAVQRFQPEKFYTVELDCGGFRAVSARYASKTEAERARAACLGKPVTVREVSRTDKTERPPKLCDLTALQREANRLFGYTAQQTLNYLQSLYEKKLATYPRTDSRYFTDDMEAGVPALAAAASAVCGVDAPGEIHAALVCDSKKVSDHHALAVTGSAAEADLTALPTGERTVLQLIAARLLYAVGSPHTYEETAVTLECGGVSFAVRGRTERSSGWKDTEQAFLSSLKQKQKRQQKEPAPPLPELAEGQRLEGGDAVLKQGNTSPPARFTEDTLLSAMEHAGAEDFAKLEDIERTGLGTPATRAATIEKLVKSGFAERRDKRLIPTGKGMALAAVLPERLKSAKLTAQWEERLKDVERGNLAPADFMAGIEAMVSEMVRANRAAGGGNAALSQASRRVIGKCPRCGRDVVEGKKSFFCEAWRDTPPCGFALWKNDRFFSDKRKALTPKIAAALLKDGRVRLKNLFSEKKGVMYDATVILDDGGGKFVHYKMEFDNTKSTNRKGKGI
ncbi:MAG: DNA topoisomerase III [Oscillospiraceae bacterium]|nr:DNA topoisomerase III [Oscillospiraceae bacterium]